MKPGDALQMAQRSDPGMVRMLNEDAVFADAALGLAILADGMGGYNAGEVASGMASTLLSSNFSRIIPACDNASSALDGVAGVRQLLGDEIRTANAAIFNTAQSQPQYHGMGTTLVVAWFIDNRLYVGHVGDSRLYRWRSGHLEQLTRDHSLLQEQLDAGVISPEEARFSNQRNLVTRALGIEPEVEVEVHDYAVCAGDIILLCSDGLNDMLEDAEIAAVLGEFAGQDLALAADQLVAQANAAGGRDNVSVILVRVAGDYAAPQGWWRKLLAGLK